MGFLTVAETICEYRYALVFVDHFSKFAIVMPTRDQTSITTAKHFFYVLGGFSGINKSRSTLYHPLGNGVCERFNITLLGMIHTLEQGHHDQNMLAMWFGPTIRQFTNPQGIHPSS